MAHYIGGVIIDYPSGKDQTDLIDTDQYVNQYPFYGDTPWYYDPGQTEIVPFGWQATEENP